jgi:hypothetical protein
MQNKTKNVGLIKHMFILKCLNRHDITEILLKVALTTITQTPEILILFFNMQNL